MVPPRRSARASKKGVGGVNKQLADSGNSGEQPGTSRFDSSLFQLAERFKTFLQAAEGACVDLNSAVAELDIALHKRRLYDITNVMEGMGLIEKTGKNMVRYLGESKDAAALCLEQQTRSNEQALWLAEEEGLDRQITELQAAISTALGPTGDPKLYLVEEDILTLPAFSADTIFAVSAPPRTSLVVRDPEEDLVATGALHFRLSLESPGEPIVAHLISNDSSAVKVRQDAPSQSECCTGTAVEEGGPGPGCDSGASRGARSPHMPPAAEEQLPAPPLSADDAFADGCLPGPNSPSLFRLNPEESGFDWFSADPSERISLGHMFYDLG